MTTYEKLTREIKELDRQIEIKCVKLDALQKKRKALWYEREKPQYTMGRPFDVCDAEMSG